ncbi:hypothetical protein [Okeania sp. SIO3B5]|nr:hypothetical protein [Okeania sp. SIO3B5]
MSIVYKVKLLFNFHLFTMTGASDALNSFNEVRSHNSEVKS